MPRALMTSQRAFPIALALTLIFALLPGGGFGVTALASEVFELVLTPFTVPMNAVGQWLRPPPRLPLMPDEIDAVYVQHLQEQMVEFERLYLAEQAKVDSLARQLEQLQKIPSEQLRTPVNLIMARVALRAATSPMGPVTLNRGSRHGVKPGSVAVYEGVHLLGRVSDDVSNVQSTLLPLANASTGLIDAAIVPQERRQTVFASAPRIQLRPRGDGTFIGQVERLQTVQVGDEVKLLDPSWPASAQAMQIGIVESVKPDDMQPLRNVVIVRPTYQISDVAEVVLKIEIDESAPHVGNGAGDEGRAGSGGPG